eukprot:8314-Heterococcus_DN1.PRE.4
MDVHGKEQLRNCSRALRSPVSSKEQQKVYTVLQRCRPRSGSAWIHLMKNLHSCHGGQLLLSVLEREQALLHIRLLSENMEQYYNQAQSALRTATARFAEQGVLH